MLRCLPGALDPGAPPVFGSPDQVIAWVRAVEWLVGADRAVALHIDGEGRLTCVATAQSRFQYLGPFGREAMAIEAVECATTAVVAVDLRQRLPAKGPSSVDQRRHQALGLQFALHGVALLDTVIVTPSAGISVTGSLSYPLGAGLSWLQVHVPARPSIGLDGEWAHEDAGAFPPGSAALRNRIERPTLWLAPDPSA